MKGRKEYERRNCRNVRNMLMYNSITNTLQYKNSFRIGSLIRIEWNQLAIDNESLHLCPKLFLCL